jgi:LacI family transcriptional regulator/LacI family repressor for deo operon, udp, cdd, tsx, nupC, and nupG
MNEAGLAPRVIIPPWPPKLPATTITFDDTSAMRGYELALDIWTNNKADRPTAVFCFHDMEALGVSKALRELSLRIPEDVSIVSVDDLPTIRHLEVPLTTFSLPGIEIGRLAAELLLRRLAGDQGPPQCHLIPARFIQRHSTARPLGK